jgi:fatty acid CoA ligase FadD21
MMAISVGGEFTAAGGSVARVQPSLSLLLRERASLQPDDTALTFIDYEQDRAGVAESLTWLQLYRRALNVGQELTRCGSAKDRAAILAPQGLEYIAAFLGAMQAGFIAVPLMVPQVGAPDERVSAVLEDATPTVILTTSAVAGSVTEYVAPAGNAAPSVIEVDLLDLDSRSSGASGTTDSGGIAYLQYTSGSTRVPAGVMISHRNLQVNFEQLMSDYFFAFAGMAPPDTTIVSWLPFYHDMGLILGVCGPILGGYRGELTSPVAFLQRPARWLQSLASHHHTFTAAPNFAFELAARRTSDDDMAGLDLGGVLGIVSGSERTYPATLNRFTERFARFNLRDDVMRPSYGLAEATVYVATRTSAGPPKVVQFASEKLSAGYAHPCEDQTGTPLLSYGMPDSPTVRIVNPDTSIGCPVGTIGEIWVHGENVADGYWERPAETERTFGATLLNPAAGTPDGPWLRTGDLGFVSEDELFIVGRIKDLLIIYGRNHYPEDIEATVGEITRGRVSAISVPFDHTEQLVAIIELKKRGDAEEATRQFDTVNSNVTGAVAAAHGVNVADLVLVEPGSIPTTTSGKIRRAACVELYLRDQFTRLDD